MCGQVRLEAAAAQLHVVLQLAGLQLLPAACLMLLPVLHVMLELLGGRPQFISKPAQRMPTQRWTKSVGSDSITPLVTN